MVKQLNCQGGYSRYHWFESRWNWGGRRIDQGPLGSPGDRVHLQCRVGSGTKLVALGSDTYFEQISVLPLCVSRPCSKLPTLFGKMIIDSNHTLQKYHVCNDS